jgi:cbb3-type cytochrome oxidase subunit 3
MKFINYLESITGVSIFPLTGLLIFVIFFVAVSIYVFTADKKQMEHDSQLPLEQ